MKIITHQELETLCQHGQAIDNKAGYPAVVLHPDGTITKIWARKKKLISSATLDTEERAQTGIEMLNRLVESNGPVHVILPNKGIEEWDREGEPAHDPEGLAAYLEAMRNNVRQPVTMSEIDAHINDQAFADEALKILDEWIASGTVATTI
jgi:uncharacterized protein (UPF0261 family)